MVEDAQIVRSAARRVVRIPGRNGDGELVVVVLIVNLRAAHAIEACAVERDVPGQPLIDGNGATGVLYGRAVIGNRVWIEHVARAVGAGVGGDVERGPIQGRAAEWRERTHTVVDRAERHAGARRNGEAVAAK